MRAARFGVVLLLLVALPSDGFSQLLPRRRVNWDALLKAQAEKAAPLVAKVLADEIIKALKEMSYADLGAYMDLVASLQLFAEIEMDPEVAEKLDSITDRHSREAAKELIDKGSASLLLSESAKFTDKLKKEKFSAPVLEKIRLQLEKDLGQGDSTSFSMCMGDFLDNANRGDWLQGGGIDFTKKMGDKRAVTCHVSHRPKDPGNKTPLTVHCSLAFTTAREGKRITKTLSFDLYLQELQQEEGAKFAYPWKVKNVQHK